MSVMLKEYRVMMPLSVEEYQRGQRYMIQKMSRIESEGEGHGVEFIKNEVYTDQPDGLVQYTKKVFHTGKRLPVWLKKLNSQSFQFVEESWNRYPVIHTEHRHTHLKKSISVTIDTKYVDKDWGQQENIFNLTPEQLALRVVEPLDMVNDSSECSLSEMKPEVGDPRTFKSECTGRGPLETSWRQELRQALKSDPAGTSGLCVYKLCRIEVNLPCVSQMVMQFIDENMLRPPTLRGSRAIWCWQDEWHSLTLDQVYQLELETAEILRNKLPPELRYNESLENVISENEDSNKEGATHETIEQPSFLSISRILPFL